MSSSSNWIRVTRSEPCPICESPDWCGISQDKQVAHCMRVESDKAVDSGGWIHRLNSKQLRTLPRSRQATKKRLSAKELHAKWAPIAKKMHKQAGDNVTRLARSLGVASWALDELHVGYGTVDGLKCWTFPEQDARRQVIGIKTRLVIPIKGNNKLYARGSRPGLTYTWDFLDYAGPVHIVEGGSDTAAGLTLGLAVIGRPSNVGGVNYLAPLLRNYAGDKRIVVFAERDRKKHDDLKPMVRAKHDPKCPGCMRCWPGKVGAMQTAERLRKRLDRKVEWRFLPDGAKDLRNWLNAQHVDVEDYEATFRLGSEAFK